MNNRYKFGILRGTNKRIFTTSGNKIHCQSIEDDHKPFERRSENEFILIFLQPFIDNVTI